MGREFESGHRCGAVVFKNNIQQKIGFEQGAQIWVICLLWEPFLKNITEVGSPTFLSTLFHGEVYALI
jgi:hypothetical protein